VADHVERGGETIEEATVAISIDHLLAVPHGVVQARPVVDGGIEAKTVVVEGLASEDLGEEVVRVPAAPAS
jgi:hypothetical protein